MVYLLNRIIILAYLIKLKSKELFNPLLFDYIEIEFDILGEDLFGKR